MEIEKLFLSIWRKLGELLKLEGMASTDNETTITFSTPPEGSIRPVQPVSASEPISTPLLWDTPQNAFHSLRVMCDEAGLTYKQKNILCACVYQESQFLNTAIGRNKDLKTGKVWSTDWGIFQVNDTKGWHIGKGLRFSSVQDVLDHPEKAAKWMIETMETTGKLQPWASYTSGAYKKWLVDNSPMWKLKVV